MLHTSYTAVPLGTDQLNCSPWCGRKSLPRKPKPPLFKRRRQHPRPPPLQRRQQFLPSSTHLYIYSAHFEATICLQKAVAAQPRASPAAPPAATSPPAQRAGFTSPGHAAAIEETPCGKKDTESPESYYPFLRKSERRDKEKRRMDDPDYDATTL